MAAVTSSPKADQIMFTIARSTARRPGTATRSAARRGRTAGAAGVARTALLGAVLATAALAPQSASAKAKHHHHTHAKRAEVPTQSCSAGDMTMTGSGTSARLWVCDKTGTWSEAVYAVSKGGHTSTVNAGRAFPR